LRVKRTRPARGAHVCGAVNFAHGTGSGSRGSGAGDGAGGCGDDGAGSGRAAGVNVNDGVSRSPETLDNPVNGAFSARPTRVARLSGGSKHRVVVSLALQACAWAEPVSLAGRCLPQVQVGRRAVDGRQPRPLQGARARGPDRTIRDRYTACVRSYGTSGRDGAFGKAGNPRSPSWPRRQSSSMNCLRKF
jgi:hypothetical protein